MGERRRVIHMLSSLYSDYLETKLEDNLSKMKQLHAAHERSMEKQSITRARILLHYAKALQSTEKEPKSWFSTDNGTHIPVYGDESNEEASKNFFKDKENEKKEEPTKDMNEDKNNEKLPARFEGGSFYSEKDEKTDDWGFYHVDILGKEMRFKNGDDMIPAIRSREAEIRKESKNNSSSSEENLWGNENIIKNIGKQKIEKYRWYNDLETKEDALRNVSTEVFNEIRWPKADKVRTVEDQDRIKRHIQTILGENFWDEIKNPYDR